MLNAVTHTIALLLQDANAATTVPAALPIEILAEIISHLPACDRLQVGTVCHYWRVAATTFPRVWADLQGVYASPQLALALGRSGTVPVKLGFRLRYNDGGHRLFAHVEKHMSHIKRLWITVSEEWRHDLNDALAAPAPLLEEATVVLETAFGSPSYSMREDAFGGNAPRLRGLALSGIAVPFAAAPGLRGVRHLRIRFKSACADDLCGAHEHFPALESYEVDLEKDLVPTRGPAVVAPAPATLQVFRVPRAPAALLAALPHAGARRVVLKECDGPAALGVLPDLQVPTRLVLLADDRPSSQPGRYALAAADASGRERIAMSLRTQALPALLTPDVRTHLRALVTDAHLWALPPAVRIDLPRLETLHLVVREAALPTSLVAPALGVLRLSLRGRVAQTGDIGDVDALLHALASARAVVVQTDGFVDSGIRLTTVVAQSLDSAMYWAVENASQNVGMLNADGLFTHLLRYLDAH